MARYQTPGVYFEWLSTQPANLQIQRTDITGFVGICERGPLHSRQKIESWTQFTSIFGGCIPQAYLAYAVQGFFANGGRTCWVVRVADPDTARCAWTNLPDENDGIAVSLRGLTPGTWAHHMEVNVLRSGSEHFSLTLSLPDGTQELWRDLTLESAEQTLNDDVTGSRLVKAFLVHPPHSTLPGKTLRDGRFHFRNGQDGLKSLRPEHLSGNGAPPDKFWGLALLDDISEISLLAMPDLMTKDVRQRRTYQPPTRCDVIPEHIEMATILPTAQVSATPLQSGTLASMTDEFRSASAPLPVQGRKRQEIEEKKKQREKWERAEAEAAAKDVRSILPSTDTDEPEYPPALDETAIIDIQMRMILQCEMQKNRMALIDLPQSNMLPMAATKWMSKGNFDSSYAALYYPWLRVPDPNGRPGDLRSIPPSGHVAGVYARVEKVFGVHKPPANELLALAQDVSMPVSDVIHGFLNENKVNALRAYPGRGLRVAGARTLSSNSQLLYINVRRLMIMIERSIDVDTQWMPFEPNNQRMWRDTERVVSNFLDLIWRRGMLDGATPTEAYFVHCDATTNPSTDTNLGRLLCLIGVRAPSAVEFVIARIGRTESGSQVLEG